MSISLSDRIIYSQIDDTLEDFTAKLTCYDAINYNLKLENEILNKWAKIESRQKKLTQITCGLAAKFLTPIHSKHEVEERITALRTYSLKLDEKARIIQRILVNNKYREDNKVAIKLQVHQNPQFNSTLSTATSLLKAWVNQRNINIIDGFRGQVIWDSTKTLREELYKEGYYVFLHAHSYPIMLHLELASHLESMHQSEEFKEQKHEALRKRFRTPGVAHHFENTQVYLGSKMAKSINSGMSMDDNHRESIISCDVIPDNNELFESTQHFFKSNKSIVDTNTSTGMKHAEFDHSFIKSYIKNEDAINYAVQLFTEARSALQEIVDYGMIRIIAIAKKTIENPKTNYVWRAHAFGRLCTCRHTKSKFGHAEFIETLKRHHQGTYEYCTTAGKKTVPQYRILASNLDLDLTKQVYTLDCLNSQERNRSQEIFATLRNSIIHLIRLEELGNCKTIQELAHTLKEINPHNSSPHYRSAVFDALKNHKSLLKQHKETLKSLLPKEVYNLVYQKK